MPNPLDSAPVPEGLRRAEVGWLGEQLGVAVRGRPRAFGRQEKALESEVPLIAI